MTLKERKEIADGLWHAACEISNYRQEFCCHAIRDDSALGFFVDLFGPKTELDIMERAGGAWMAWKKEGNADFQDQNRLDRFLALLLAREIALNGD